MEADSTFMSLLHVQGPDPDTSLSGTNNTIHSLVYRACGGGLPHSLGGGGRGGMASHRPQLPARGGSEPCLKGKRTFSG